MTGILDFLTTNSDAILTGAAIIGAIGLIVRGIFKHFGDKAKEKADHAVRDANHAALMSNHKEFRRSQRVMNKRLVRLEKNSVAQGKELKSLRTDFTVQSKKINRRTNVLNRRTKALNKRVTALERILTRV